MLYPKDYTWLYSLEHEFRRASYRRLCEKIEQDLSKGVDIYPYKWNIFRALDSCPPYAVKAVILGQDPYHAPGVATGYSFGTMSNAKVLPASLKNIFRALKIDLRIENKSGELDTWANQGVLLLNTVLTVERGRPLSHENIGWESVTDGILKILNEGERPIAFCLWGKKAQEKKKLITSKKHLIIESSHPSPQSAHQGFLFHKPFSQINRFCQKNGYYPINWQTY
jgi:uracil-DNA glycosylase